jgi:hypothetical protein
MFPIHICVLTFAFALQAESSRLFKTEMKKEFVRVPLHRTSVEQHLVKSGTSIKWPPPRHHFKDGLQPIIVPLFYIPSVITFYFDITIGCPPQPFKVLFALYEI